MLIEPMIQQLQQLRLRGMAAALEQLLDNAQHAALSFEERLSVMIQHEITDRDSKRLAQRLRWAKLPQSAALEDLDTRTPRGIDPKLIAVLSAVMNNLPTTLVGALSVAEVSDVPALVHQAMVYATVIGADLGPKMTPIGSLATLLWLHVLARKGLEIGWGAYFRMGITLTLPVLIFTLAALAGWLHVLS